MEVGLHSNVFDYSFEDYGYGNFLYTWVLPELGFCRIPWDSFFFWRNFFTGTSFEGPKTVPVFNAKTGSFCFVRIPVSLCRNSIACSGFAPEKLAEISVRILIYDTAVGRESGHKTGIFLPETSFLELDHVYICYMPSHVKFG